MDTTRVAWLSDQSGWGRMRTMTSLTPSAQTIHGPLQGLANFLAVPGFTEGVSSQTLVWRPAKAVEEEDSKILPNTAYLTK